MPSPLRALRYRLGNSLLHLLLALSPLAGVRLWRASGERLGTLLWWLAPQERRRMLQHLRLAFPETGESWQKSVARACARHLGCLAGEAVWLWRVSPTTLLSHTTFRGLENLDESVRDGQGAVIVTAHCGNWEWLNLALAARGTPLTVAVRTLDNPRLDKTLRHLRGRWGGTSIGRGERAGRALAKACLEGATIGLLIDQDIDAAGCFVEFFGRPAWTPTGAAMLARRLRRPIVPSFAVRQPGGDMLLTFDPPLDPCLSANADADVCMLTARLTARIEEQIRTHPEQWVWMHRRWRRQPREGERIYRYSATMPTRHPSQAGTVAAQEEVPWRSSDE